MILLTIAVRPAKLIGAREMNKRIEELIVQAGDYVNETYTGPVPATFTGNPEWHKKFDKWTQFSEKFAELIVRECDRLNRKQSFELTGVVVDVEQGDGFDSVCLDTVKRVESYLADSTLKKHFGVEE